MRYLSVCSGIEAATVAWHPLGWEPAAFSEIERFPCAVLAHHYPDVPNLGDMTTIDKDVLDGIGPVQLIVGGTPCQSFSVAGLRKGMADPRGNLALVFLGIVDAARPRWVVWENVPGVLSSSEGRDFGSFLGALGELGYGWAYRVLDAQYVRVDGHERAVPQRRRRVFVVGHLGDWRRAAAVLFERESVSGNPAPSRETRSSVADLTAKGVGTCGADDNQAQAGHLVGVTNFGEQEVSTALTAHGQRLDTDTDTETMIAHTLKGEGHDASEDGTGMGVPIVPILEVGKGTTSRGAGPNGCGIGKVGDPMFTLQAGAQHAIGFSLASHPLGSEEVTEPITRRNGDAGCVAFDLAQITSNVNRTRVSPELPASTLNAAGQMHAAYHSVVRRLTPTECERLQGFPDGYTNVPTSPVAAKGQAKARASWKAGDGRFAEISGVMWVIAKDGPRYKALGNSMATNVMRWIGRRIQQVEAVA